MTAIVLLCLAEAKQIDFSGVVTPEGHASAQELWVEQCVAKKGIWQ